LSDTTKVATLSSGGFLEYQVPVERQVFPYEGDLVHIETKFLDLAVTPDHMMYARPDENAEFIFTRASELPPRSQFRRDCEWVGEEADFVFVGPHQISMDIWLEFLGYYISEGCCGTSGRLQHRVQISQHAHDEKRAKMAACFEKLPFRFQTVEAGFTFDNKYLFEELAPLGKSPVKFVPPLFKGLCRRQIRILLEALTVGDGFDGRSGNHGKHVEWMYCTASPKLADDVQELALKAGYCSNLAIQDRRGRAVVIKGRGQTGITNYLSYTVSIHSENKVAGFRGKIKGRPTLKYQRRPYAGTVFCVTVPNHVIYVRRNGKSCWNGQCYEPWADSTNEGYGTEVRFQVYIDNGSGTASDALIAAVATKLNGNFNTNTPAYRPAGVPYDIFSDDPVLANVSVSGTLGPLSNPSQINSAVQQAVSGYFTLPFGQPASQGPIAADVANAALGQLTSLSVNLYYATAPSTAVNMVSGALYQRVILNQLSINLSS